MECERERERERESRVVDGGGSMMKLRVESDEGQRSISMSFIVYIAHDFRSSSLHPPHWHTCTYTHLPTHTHTHTQWHPGSASVEALQAHPYAQE